STWTLTRGRRAGPGGSCSRRSRPHQRTGKGAWRYFQRVISVKSSRPRTRANTCPGSATPAQPALSRWPVPVPDAHAVAVPVKHLNMGRSTVEEGEPVAGQRVEMKLGPDQCRQAIGAAAQVGRRGGAPDLDRRRQQVAKGKANRKAARATA